MNIVEFFQQSSGKWFSQRSVSGGSLKQPKTTKSDVQVEFLDKTDPAVVEICQTCGADPAFAFCGLRASWATIPDLAQSEKASGSTVLVAIADPATPHQGNLLQAGGYLGSYILGSDEALTLNMGDKNLRIEERIWFASPNLRLRSSILNHTNGASQSSFCSEIRMGGVKPPEQK